MAWATALNAEQGWSLEKRLRNRLLLALLGLWLVGSSLALYVQWRENTDVLDAAQEETAATLLRLPALSSSATTLQALPRPPAERPQRLLMQVFTTEGQLVWRSPQAPSSPLAPLHVPLTEDRGDWRVVVRPAPTIDRVALVAASLQDRREALRHSVEALLLPLLGLLPLTALTVTWLLRQVFQGLDDVYRELRTRSTDELQPLDHRDLPQEFQPMVQGLNQLFQRLTEVRQAERAFAANSAHELRTPLAAAQAQLQRLSHELQDARRTTGAAALDPALQRVDALGRQLDRLQRLCVKLLQLSRAEAGVGRHTAPVDLQEVARMVLDGFHHPEQQTRLRLTVAPQDKAPAGAPVMALSDMDALGIALRNLVENALLHGGRHGPIEVRVLPQPAIEVIDTGPGVPPDRLQAIQQPFLRGESSSPGHGLGLAIVATIARQMGGRLLLQSPVQDGRGFKATLVLQPA